MVCRVFKKKNYQKSIDSPKTTSPTSMDSEVHLLNSNNDGVLDQILQYMGRTCKLEMEYSFSNMNNNNSNSSSRLILSPNNNNNEQQQHTIDKSFMHLPRLDSPTTAPSIIPLHQLETVSPFDDNMLFNQDIMFSEATTEPPPLPELLHGRVPIVKIDNWVAFDRLVASQLNGHEERCIEDDDEGDEQQQQHNHHHHMQISNKGLGYGNENDIWGFTKSSSPSSLDPLSHLSV